MGPAEDRSSWPLLAPFRRRGVIPFVGSTLYVGVAAARAAGGESRRAWLATLAGFALAWLATKPERGPDTAARGPSLPVAGSRAADGRPALPATSYAVWGVALTAVSLGTARAADGGAAWLSVLGTAGAGVSSVAACLAARGGPEPMGIAASLARSKDSVGRLSATLLCTLALAAVAGAASPALALRIWGHAPLESVAVAYGVLALAVSAVVYGDRLRSDHLILGAAERSRVALGAILGVASVAVAVLVVRAAEPAPVSSVAAALAGLSACRCARSEDPIRLTRIGRRALALGLFGGPVVLLSVIASEGINGASATTALFGGMAALAVGTLGTWLERPLRPSEGRWLDAFEAAGGELGRADPESGPQGALRALRAAAGPSAESPELWSLDPVRVLTIDAAGYARERDASLPDKLLDVAAGEPETVLRTELLDALLVRRPDLRPLARWMDERRALAAALVMREGETCGVLVVPRHDGRQPMTLEEARALSRLADAMAGACAVKSAFARSLTREREATGRAEAAELVVDRLRHAEAIASGRLALEVAREMRGAEVGRYSPAVQFAQGALERRLVLGAPVFIVGPAGLDPVPHLAAAHVARARTARAPFVVVEGTASPEHDLERWRDPSLSPLALAQGGLLVLVDGAVLPSPVQRLVAQALSERRAPWEQAEPLDVAIACTSTRSIADLVADGRLEAALAARFGAPEEAEVVLPELSGRPEDLRALLGDRLAREGLRQRGAPVGIEDAAFARLSEYAFPDDYAELVLVARRLVAIATGDVVRAADVDALGLALPDAPRVNVRGTTSLS